MVVRGVMATVSPPDRSSRGSRPSSGGAGNLRLARLETGFKFCVTFHARVARYAACMPVGADTTRERIIDAADECFARYGVAKTTVEDIAAAATLSRATVYRSFTGGRDEVIL